MLITNHPRPKASLRFKHKKKKPWKQEWVASELHVRPIMCYLFAWIDAVFKNNCLLILFVPSSSHKEIVKQTL